MPVPVAPRRIAYRTAYRLLQLSWLLRRPSKDGVKCLLTHRERILLVRHTYGRRAWDLPGGAIKPHEAPVSAARREMLEELGVEPPRWTNLGPVRGISEHRRDTIHCFAAELPSPALKLNYGELATASWFSPSNLPPRLGPYVAPILRHASAKPLL